MVMNVKAREALDRHEWAVMKEASSTKSFFTTERLKAKLKQDIVDTLEAYKKALECK
jgi:hypothetical protein